MKKRLPVFMAILACLFATSVQADTIVFDNFNDGVLDPKWNVIKDSKVVWSYNESGGRLNINDIYYTELSRGTYGSVALRQGFQPIGDFRATVNFSWSTLYNDDSSRFMIELPWYTACLYAYPANNMPPRFILGGTDGSKGYYKVIDEPLSGSASVTILRTNQTVNYLLNNLLALSIPLDGTFFPAMNYLELNIGESNWSNARFSVDQVSLTGTPLGSPTPEPGTLALLASALGAATMVIRRRGRSKPGPRSACQALAR